MLLISQGFSESWAGAPLQIETSQEDPIHKSIHKSDLQPQSNVAPNIHFSNDFYMLEMGSSQHFVPIFTGAIPVIKTETKKLLFSIFISI